MGEEKLKSFCFLSTSQTGGRNQFSSFTHWLQKFEGKCGGVKRLVGFIGMEVCVCVCVGGWGCQDASSIKASGLNVCPLGHVWSLVLVNGLDVLWGEVAHASVATTPPA